jgi:phosphoglycerate dehydrogenase-like enzyme
VQIVCGSRRDNEIYDIRWRWELHWRRVNEPEVCSPAISYKANGVFVFLDAGEAVYDSRLLTGQTVLMLGFGAIGRRLAELLAPFGMTLSAVRRQTRSERGVRIIPEEGVSTALATADHVVNLLPDNAGTRNFFNARRIACCRPGARFYNVGRGTTVDERALGEALASGRISEAYLDVFESEPLPVAHPFWGLPNCYVTPHTAGGRHDQDTALVQHFLDNLAAFERGEKMVDRVV